MNTLSRFLFHISVTFRWPARMRKVFEKRNGRRKRHDDTNVHKLNGFAEANTSVRNN